MVFRRTFIIRLTTSQFAVSPKNRRSVIIRMFRIYGEFNHCRIELFGVYTLAIGRRTEMVTAVAKHKRISDLIASLTFYYLRLYQIRTTSHELNQWRVYIRLKVASFATLGTKIVPLIWGLYTFSCTLAQLKWQNMCCQETVSFSKSRWPAPAINVSESSLSAVWNQAMM